MSSNCEFFNPSDECFELVKHFEGKYLKAYKCPAGVWTIGYGHTGSDVYAGLDITTAQADTLLEADLTKFSKKIKPLILVDIDQAQFDALVSFSFNVGVGGLSKSSVLRFTNKMEWESASKAFMMWCKARVGGELTVLKGLVRRRAAEADLYMKHRR